TASSVLPSSMSSVSLARKSLIYPIVVSGGWLVRSTGERPVQAVAAAFPPAPRPHFYCGARAGGKAITPVVCWPAKRPDFEREASGCPGRRSGLRRRAPGVSQPKDGCCNVRLLPLYRWRHGAATACTGRSTSALDHQSEMRTG